MLPAAALLSLAALIVTCIFILGKRTGGLNVRVLDGRTDAPISGAEVVIPETGKRYTTDEKGRTGTIPVPIARDTRFDGICKKDWGEATLMIYHPGYYPYALLYVQLEAGKTRMGPDIYLFPEDGSMDAPFLVIESPDSGWAARLIEKYQWEEG